MGLKKIIDKITSKRNPKLYYTKNNLLRSISGCRIDLGLPIMKYTKDGVGIVCWGGRGEFRNTTTLIDVPMEELENMRMENPDWKELVEKHGSEKQKEKLLNSPIKVKTKYGVVEED